MRLEKQKTKLSKESSKTRRNGNTMPTSNTKVDPPELKAIAANLQPDVITTK